MADGPDKWHGTGIAGFSPTDADFLAATRITRPLSGARKAKAKVVVAVAGGVVVAVGRMDVPGVVVPRPATINPVRACMAMNHCVRLNPRTDTKSSPAFWDTEKSSVRMAHRR